MDYQRKKIFKNGCVQIKNETQYRNKIFFYFKY